MADFQSVPAFDDNGGDGFASVIYFTPSADARLFIEVGSVTIFDGDTTSELSQECKHACMLVNSLINYIINSRTELYLKAGTPESVPLLR